MGTQALLIRINGDPSQFTNAMNQVSSELDKAIKTADRANTGFAALGSRLSTIGTAMTIGITAPIVGMAAATVKAAADIDSLKRGLTSVTGSTAETARQMDRLREVAKLPGLGFPEAIQGAIRMQALGFSFEQAERVMKQFGNAIAIAGGGREDLNEVIRQLGQLAARGKVTADNLKPIIERVPQVSAIIRKEFGTIDTEVLQKMGVSSEKFIEVLLRGLEKIPQATGGAKNAMENLKDTLTVTASRIGEHLLPAVERTIPKIEAIATAAADAVDAFTKLPEPIQNTALAITGVLVAAGPLSVVAGRLVMAFGQFRSAAIVVAGTITGPYGKAISAATIALGALVTLGGNAVKMWQRMKEELDPLSGASNRFFQTIAGRFPEMENSLRALISTTGGLAHHKSTFQILGEASSRTAGGMSAATQAAKTMSSALSESTKAHISALEAAKKHHLASLELLILQDRFKDGEAEKQKVIDKSSEITRQYNTVLLSEAMLLAQLADGWQKYFRISRGIEAPPVLTSQTEDFRKIPRPVGFPELPTAPDVNTLPLPGGNRGLKNATDALKVYAGAWGKAQKEISRQISTITTDLSRGLAKVIFDGGKVGDVFKRIGRDISEALVRVAIEKGVNLLIRSLGDLLGHLGKVGRAIGSIFGLGASAAAGTAGTVAGGAGGAAGSAGSIGGSVGSSAGGVMGAVNMVSGIASAVSSIVGNFQMHGMNKSLDLIEKSSRYAEIHLLNILEKGNEYWPFMKGVWESLVRIETNGLKMAGATAGGGTYNFDFRGAQFSGGINAEAVANQFVKEFKLKGLN